MAYDPFDYTLPNPTTEDGTECFVSTRKNLVALAHALVTTGTVPGWNRSQSGGSAEQPAQELYKNGANWIKVDLTWGSSGGAAGNVTQAVLSFSSNSGGVYDTIGTITLTYDANGNCTAENWS